MTRFILLIALVVSFGLGACARGEHHDDEHHGVSVYGKW
jgi:hypothetical protein